MANVETDFLPDYFSALQIFSELQIALEKLEALWYAGVV